MDPIDTYLIENNKKFYIKDISITINIDTLKFNGHLFDGKYVYGIKFVSLDNKDFLKADIYGVGKQYIIEDSLNNLFDSYEDHTAGLWAMISIKDIIKEHIKINAKNTLTKAILVRYNIKDVIPIGNKLKIISENMDTINYPLGYFSI